jgi:excisionase family DNA binding protein
MKRKDGAKTPPHTGPVKVMTLRELSAYLHVHPTTIYRLLKRHEIPAFHIGSDWRFNIEAIDRWRVAPCGRSLPSRRIALFRFDLSAHE